ncbi:ribokinase [Salinivibrio kushneri]|uniref:Ribokinase n=1 Tax=Salinivibrio kushneri TaxID=1908198 RepID=A0AA47KJ22_9GAMM|nr:ribokinase [Salinivibrio kushneri]WBA07840.1 ribokinase [Salinivibrio kushneri]
MSRLVVLGSVNADHVLRVPHFPRPGETLHGHDYAVIAGGKGANQAVAAVRCGADVAFIASVGDDAYGQIIRQSYAQEGMDISAVKVQANTPTGIAMIQVTEQGENSIALSAEANAALTAEAITADLDKIAEADYLLMQLETPMCGIEKAAFHAKAAKTHVVLNPAPAAPLSDVLLASVDIITPNETEAQSLTGIEVTDTASAQAASDVLHEKGVGTVLITLGKQGVWLSEKGEQAGQLIPGFRVDAVDTTAAGDTFNGALVTGLIEGQTLYQAIRFAHAAAALSVTQRGAQTSIPSRSDVEAFLAHQDA